MNPVCEHSECHDVRTNTYQPTTWWTGTGNGSAGEQKVVLIGGDGPMWRRLCRIHARQDLGASFG